MTGKKKSNAPSEHYEVGYGKPPKHSRFKKGQSGNPKGRPKGRKNGTAMLAEILDQTTTIREGGRQVRLTIREVLGKVLVSQGMKGDKRAIELALRLDREAQQVEAAMPDSIGVLRVPGMVDADLWEAAARIQSQKRPADDGESEAEG